MNQLLQKNVFAINIRDMERPNRNIAAFVAKAPPPTLSQRRSKQSKQALTSLATELGLPVAMARWAPSVYRSKQAMTAFAQRYHAGCALTGVKLNDKVNLRKNDPDPHGAVARKDGSLVCHAIWMLSQQGAISDAVLRATARAIAKHQTAPKAQPPMVPTPAQPGPAPHPLLESLYGTTTITALEPRSADQRELGDTYRPGRTGATGPSKIIWDDASQTMVRVEL